ncbi:hypothetical protein L249_8068 [Ophiocordyceps polyrhachis-furcata BCC 54312]|uniref:RSE1/DDB1/CPSF1 first beta-propeller domain-containing protein n=1 Tax=Ophiocordyceps polyrhachis-furcata BCC 54312 TaxID=1330021 RepID=A0A367LHM7_9HYPO|nr:hypothetical protein L249_8068 [Ophiocordyceps polyrhachis-furcata BCC 54312]
MAFQTSVLRNGEWVTETVNVQSALRQASAAASAGPVLEQPPELPPYGLLSRTIVQSPIVHRVLPVRLRSKLRNDIAFIGTDQGADVSSQDWFVQISELRRDGQVHQVARKKNFGSRIRSAAVLGHSLEHGLDEEAPTGFFKFDDDGSVIMADAPDHPQLPPQLLVLMLESGKAVFLFLRDQPGSPIDFVTATFALNRAIPYMGYHLAVDPSSRYMAAASPEGVVAIFELEDTRALNAQFVASGHVSPVKSVKVRLLQGVLHKLEFLHPHPEDDNHIILILIHIRKERRSRDPVTRMVIYEWMVGDSLKEVFDGDRCGTRLPQEHRLPLLLIPLRFNTAFFTVSEKSIGIVRDCLSGPPVFESLGADPPSQTALHHGVRPPLWTAWARPFRRQKYFERTDIIYLAREDGAIIHIEIETGDLVPFITNVGCLDANINTAFTAAYDVYSDILLIGGDSGPGGIWKLAPRSELEQVSILPNWSPVIDAAVVTWSKPVEGAVRPKPDAVFTASGRGSKGTLTQWRWGFQGRIGLEIESDDPVRHSWAFDLYARGEDGGLCVLLAFSDSTALLRFSDDFGDADAATAQDTDLDLSSRTLDAFWSQQGTIIQVTERFVTLCTSLKSGAGSRYSLDELLGTDNVVALNASCLDDTIAISSHTERASRLHTLLVTPTGLRNCHWWEARGDLTCILLFWAAGSKYVIAGSMVEGKAWVLLYTLAGENLAADAVSSLHGESVLFPHQSVNGIQTFGQFEALTSICHVCDSAGEVHLVAGTNSGALLTVKISPKEGKPMSILAEAMGAGPVEVFSTWGSFQGTAAALVCCDNALVVMNDFCPRTRRFRAKQHVWLTDASDESMPSPAIHSVCSLRRDISGSPGHLSLMVQAKSKLLLAEIWPDVGLVPRSIRLEGSPMRVIYSDTWECLVVALLKDDKPTLAFIDPATGEAKATPADRERRDAEFITGLGHAGDRIYCLHEWNYVKDGKTFTFILVATKDGRLLMVSVGARAAGGLQYSTRYKRMLGRPIYSVVGDDQGILFCVDRTVRWEVLDLAEKRLRPMGEFRLDSPATSLSVAGKDGCLFALTTQHSVEVIDYRGKNMTLVHSDPVSRSTVHTIHGHSGMGLLSDQTGGIAVIRQPWSRRSREFEIVLETRLPTSVRRFVRAQSRPLWLSARRSLYVERPEEEVLAVHASGEILGLSLDGSLHHFFLLDMNLWRFLRLVDQLARARPEDVVEEPEPHPLQLHVDGDLLERCVVQRPGSLEEMLCTADRFYLFCRCLDLIRRGHYTRWPGKEEMPEWTRRELYVALGHDIVAHYLDPVA